ncbi:hypothetical protein [Candidatus Hodgkinia cicadicola]
MWWVYMYKQKNNVHLLLELNYGLKQKCNPIYNKQNSVTNGIK